MAIEQTADRKNYNVIWKCLCDCGTVTYKRQGSLSSGYSKSCGCLHKLPEGESSFNHLLDKYKRGARNRNLEFLLTKEEFRELTKQPCHYCGIPPSMEIDCASYNGKYVYNGIDRKDNSVGYTIENSVSCCGECNHAKSGIEYSKFLSWVYRIGAYNNNKD